MLRLKPDVQIEAIYQGGVFKLLDAAGLPENQRVRLSVQPINVSAASFRDWWGRARGKRFE